jgi:hypothetical protein
MTKLVRKRHWRCEVEWEDSSLLAASWMEVSDILSSEQRSVVRCTSVGLILADDKKGIVLASSVHGSRAAGVTVIPKGQIKKRRRLR